MLHQHKSPLLDYWYKAKKKKTKLNTLSSSIHHLLLYFIFLIQSKFYPRPLSSAIKINLKYWVDFFLFFLFFYLNK